MALYDDAVKLAKDYIGPAGKKFIDRQISSHLGIEPDQLGAGHLEELAKWCLSSGKMLIGPDKARLATTMTMGVRSAGAMNKISCMRNNP